MNTAFSIPIDKLTNSDEGISVRIKKIIAEKLCINEYEILDEFSFADDLNVDSLDVLEIIVEIEKDFQISIPDENQEKLTTVGRLINYIIQRKN